MFRGEQVGRVSPLRAAARLADSGAHGVTRPTLKRRHLHRMRIEELGVGADESETAGVQLFHAEAGKISDHQIFPRHDLGEVKRTRPARTPQVPACSARCFTSAA